MRGSSSFLGRFSDFRSSNEVVMEEPRLTESVLGGGERELLGPGPGIPFNIHETHGPIAPPIEPKAVLHAAVSDIAPDVDRVDSGSALGIGKSEGESQDQVSPVLASSSFRWKKMSWPDGGRTNSLAFGGGGILLSKRGWEEWRLWAAAISGGNGGDDGPEEDSRPQEPQVYAPEPQTPEQIGAGVFSQPPEGNRAVDTAAGPIHPCRESSSTVYQSRRAECDSNERSAPSLSSLAAPATQTRSPVGGNEPVAVPDEAVATIAEWASALDIHLSRACLVLEPWDYADVGRTRSGQFDTQAGMETGGCARRCGGDGSAVVVRVNLAMRMTSALFLEGYWAARLCAGRLPSRYGTLVTKFRRWR